jgi:hypothetical protein
LRPVAAGVQILGVLEQEPTRALEEFAVAVVGQLAIEIATQGAEFVVVKFDHMEVIEDVDGVRQVVAHGPDVGLAHVGGDGSNFGSRGPQTLPKPCQSRDALAVGHWLTERGKAYVEKNRKV